MLIKNPKTRKNKFPQDYFIQFHVEKFSHVRSIGIFLRKKNLGNIPKIVLGINADKKTLNDINNIRKIKNIILECSKYNLEPCLHYSFKNSDNIFDDIKNIKSIFPNLYRIQINDIKIITHEFIKKTSYLFKIDIPFSNNNFHYILNPKIMKIIIDNEFYVLLDDSQGRGIKEEKSSLISKINCLIRLGVNNIGIYGGFGPSHTDLKTYIDIALLYKMSFSIDAETKLKYKGKISIRKTKKYLNNLIKFHKSIINNNYLE